MIFGISTTCLCFNNPNRLIRLDTIVIFQFRLIQESDNGTVAIRLPLVIDSLQLNWLPAMDERANVTPGLPRSQPTVSYWQDPPDPEIADYQSAQTLPQYVDYAIVGSGISGTMIAWGLLDQLPAKQVAIFEARQACSGATGRNGR